jgi:hypothetical protein
MAELQSLLVVKESWVVAAEAGLFQPTSMIADIFCGHIDVNIEAGVKQSGRSLSL